jgi:hypothetical protein
VATLLVVPSGRAVCDAFIAAMQAYGVALAENVIRAGQAA